MSLIKILIIGDTTESLLELVRKQLSKLIMVKNNISTGEFDHSATEIFDDNEASQVQLWVISSESQLKMQREIYFQEANGILAMFDLTDRKTLDNLLTHLKEYKKYTKTHITIPCVVVGYNKELRDPVSAEHITTEVALKKTKDISVLLYNGLENIHYFETDITTGENIDRIQQYMSQLRPDN